MFKENVFFGSLEKITLLPEGTYLTLEVNGEFIELTYPSGCNVDLLKDLLGKEVSASPKRGVYPLSNPLSYGKKPRPKIDVPRLNGPFWEDLVPSLRLEDLPESEDSWQASLEADFGNLPPKEQVTTPWKDLMEAAYLAHASRPQEDSISRSFSTGNTPLVYQEELDLKSDISLESPFWEDLVSSLCLGDLLGSEDSWRDSLIAEFENLPPKEQAGTPWKDPLEVVSEPRGEVLSRSFSRDPLLSPN